jgi:glucosamine-6-phosphate deaminase
VPATYLQDHENALMVLDRAAASQLTRIQTPWLVGPLQEMGFSWSDSMPRRAVAWLAQKTGKAVLKLTDEDYNSHSLQELLSQHGNAYEINLRVFRQVQNTITGWPGGKPKTADAVAEFHGGGLSETHPDFFAQPGRQRFVDGRDVDPAGRTRT